MPRKVVQIKKIGTVTLSQNIRSKNIKISVKPDKTVLVSFPFYVSASEALSVVQKNSIWICLQQEKMEVRKNNVLTNGKTIFTRSHTVHLLQGDFNKVDVNKHEVNIYVSDFETSANQLYIEKILVEIYRFEAKSLLPVKLNELAIQHGFRYNKVTIRNNKRNWGSCSSKNNISLNLQMMKLPDHLIDYILLHELVHTEIKNHGKTFWEKLNAVSGNQARKLAKEVKQYSTYTL